jgi:hypothetical protein
VTFIRSRQIGWTERNSRSPFDFAQGSSPLRFAPVGMTNSFKTRKLHAKINIVTASQDDDSVVS